MTWRRPLIPAVVAATVALAPAAAAQAPPPTLQWDRECYTEHQPMTFTGTGFTPSGPVDLLFSRPGFVYGSFETSADAAGAISDYVMAEEGQLLGDDEDRALRFATANDRTRIEQGTEPDAQFAPSSFTFTRWMGFSPGRYVPGRTVEVEAYGWAFAAGKTLWFQFLKGRTTVASVKVGKLSATCGDRVGRIRVPRKLKAGAYRLALSTEKRGLSDLYTWRKGRVAKAGAASSSAGARRAMARG
jgi:hypothetical protein